MRRSRSRRRDGGRPSGGHRDGSGGHRDGGGHRRDGGHRDGGGHRRDSGPRGGGKQEPERPQAARAGHEKAKELMLKEKEKARLKKLEREKALQDKEARKEQVRADKQREYAELAEAEAPTKEPGAASLAEGTARAARLASAAPVPPEPTPPTASAGLGRAAPRAKQAPARRQSHGPARAPEAPANGEEVRKLFDLLDRSRKGQVSQRDVLVALRKHPPVRQLFGLPVGAEQGAAGLEARLLAIQDAFEGGGGLGELSALFERLRAADGAGGTSFTWGAFLACCRQDEALRGRVAAAVGILPREHSAATIFAATSFWQEVPEGAACPPGLEFKMDLESGRKLARLPPSGGAMSGRR